MLRIRNRDVFGNDVHAGPPDLNLRVEALAYGFHVNGRCPAPVLIGNEKELGLGVVFPQVFEQFVCNEDLGFGYILKAFAVRGRG